MRSEERWDMYFSIQQMKKQGFTKSQASRNMNISRNTVIKFWDMSVHEYKRFLESMESRARKLDEFQSEIVGWLRVYPDLSAAQVADWLKERKWGLGVAESTVRNYVRDLRLEYGIPKVLRIRQYEAVEDPPMGKQIQVDFGETKLRRQDGCLVKLRFITFVLSHSRYKYALWQDRPFTTADVVHAHEQAFAFYGGLPEEIVYDQDHLLLVSENHGDLILTQEFAVYVDNRKFRIHMCRKADPESKGRIENVVKYIKRNFARHRPFANVDKLNEECLAWLARTGNANVHQTTKKIPAEVYALEKAYLRPITKKIESSNILSITRTVRKDNTIYYQGNRYTVPLGTYDGSDKVVHIQTSGDNRLIIRNEGSDHVLAEHEICMHKKGELIRNNNHGRDRTRGISEYIERVVGLFTDSELARQYLEEIRRRQPRYIRDQLQAIENALEEASAGAADEALAYCNRYGLYRATDVTDAVSHFQEKQRPAAEYPETQDLKLLAPVDTAKLKTKPEIRDFNAYIRILGGGAHVGIKC